MEREKRRERIRAHNVSMRETLSKNYYKVVVQISFLLIYCNR